jgi:hypothetical protein
MLSNANAPTRSPTSRSNARPAKWFYWKTARYGDREERHGPYSSIASVTLMIARQLTKDIIKRDGSHHLPE